MLYLQTTFTENFSLALLTFTRLNKYITAKLFLPLGSCEFNNSTRSNQVVTLVKKNIGILQIVIFWPYLVSRKSFTTKT